MGIKDVQKLTRSQPIRGTYKMVLEKPDRAWFISEICREGLSFGDALVHY
jgi:hypothetical protein